MARTCTRDPVAKAAKAENARASKPERRNLDMVKKTKKGRAATIKWSKKEDSRLERVVDAVNASDECKHYRWSSIAAKMPGRNAKQCRERWMHRLRPGIKKGDWTDDEDRLILSLQDQLGNKWKKISEQLPGRSDNCVKNRWHSFRRSLENQGNKTTAGLFDASTSSPSEGNGMPQKPVDSNHQLENKWKKINEQLPGRSDNCVKNRCHSFRRSLENQGNKTTAGLFDASTSSPSEGNVMPQKPVDSSPDVNFGDAPTVSDGARAGCQKCIAELRTGEKTKFHHCLVCPLSKLNQKWYEAKSRHEKGKGSGLTRKAAKHLSSAIYKTPTKKTTSLPVNPVSALGVPVNHYEQEAASTLSAMRGCFWSEGVEVLGSHRKENDPPAMTPYRSPNPYSVRANDIFSPSYSPKTPTPATALTATSQCHSGPFFRNVPMFKETNIALNGVAIGNKSSPIDYVDIVSRPESTFSLDSPSPQLYPV